MRALFRALRSRFWALLAVSVTVTVAAGFAALNATAWVSGLPQGARQDLLASPADGVLISRPAKTAADDAATDKTVRAAVARAVPAGAFDLESVAMSDVFDLPSGVVNGVQQQTYAVSSTSVRQHAVLTSGSWPSSAPGPTIDAALPLPTLQTLGLHVGGTLTVHDPLTRAAISFLITGSYQYSTLDAGSLLWNQIGPSGVEPDGPSTYFGPLVADPAAFTSGALPTAGGSWVLTPTGNDLDLPALAAQANALTKSAELAPQSGYTVSTTLPALVDSLSTRISAGRAQLLAAGILLGLLAGIALAASVGNLVSRGAAQAALLRSRGAPRKILVSFYAADIAIVFVFAAIGTLVQEPLLGNSFSEAAGDSAGNSPVSSGGFGASGIPPGAWVAGLAVALVAGVIICARAARPAESAAVAAASGRQSAAPGIIRAGADIALIALAGMAVWQAGDVGLSVHDATANGGSSLVLIVAAAPALAAAAGAALCGRLVTAAARLSERAARRARSLPTRLAAWELARTPLRYLVPALLCVAAVAGCGYSAAQHASWLRSAHDQAAFATGADVAVGLRQVLPLGQVATVGNVHGALAATPVAQVDLGDGALLAVDSKTAAGAIALRPDLAGQPVADLWSKLTPAQASASSAALPESAGISVPGRPTALGVNAALTGTGTGTGEVPVTLLLTVQDATGLTYSVPLGVLPADGAPHALSARIAATGQADYPLRIIGLTLESTTPSDQPASSVLTVSGLTEKLASGGSSGGSSGDGPGGNVTFAGAEALTGWSSNILWAASTETCELSMNPVQPKIQANRSPGGSGAVLDWSGGSDCTDTPTLTTVSMAPAAASGLIVPAIATASYLSANDEHVGSADRVTVNGVPVKIRIVASVAAFPALTAQNPNALIVDLTTFTDAANAGGAQLWPTYTWWLRTADGRAPSGLPPGALISTTADAQAALIADPLSAIPQRILTIGAPTLILLAMLGLLISLLAASRDAAARDMVLSALGTTRPQRAALACLLHSCVVLPAAILGAGLGFLLARILTPVFVLAPDATPPQPPAVVLFDAPWSVAAVLAILAATVAAALAASLSRADPLALARAGG